RDRTVTGVQTCALPIFRRSAGDAAICHTAITVDKNGRVLYGYSDGCVTDGCIAGTAPNDFTAFMRVARQSGGETLFASYDGNTRSEERRVGIRWDDLGW